jgi:hypothetical protein
MPSNASRRHETIYSHVQYLGCHRIKYNEAAARTTRVYPIIFGINKKTVLWFRSELDRDATDGPAFPFAEVPFCVRDGEVAMNCYPLPLDSILIRRTGDEAKSVYFCPLILRKTFPGLFRFIIRFCFTLCKYVPNLSSYLISNTSYSDSEILQTKD